MGTAFPQKADYTREYEECDLVN